MLTDNEIMKDLEYKVKHMTSADYMFLPDILDIINRLRKDAEKDNRIIELQDKKIAEQKAEIERLHIEGLQINEIFMDFVNKQKIEAMKEFAESLKENVNLCSKYLQEDFPEIVDNLVKERITHIKKLQKDNET
jgi:hypothetical protein